MAKRKTTVKTEPIAEQAELMVLNPLELKVTKNVVGVLETNIEQLETYVNAKLEEYRPELYLGDADMARKDRAELNNSKKVLSQARISLIKELMKPYEDFETRCKALEKKIDEASGQLDSIVKEKEEQEKTAKKIRCEEIWLSKNFVLFPLEKIFNAKWLNKTTKESEISNEMDSIIERTYKDLKLIERFGTDADTLKAHYLISLDIEETLGYGEELSKTRELAEQEARERDEREHNQQIAKQQQELVQESLDEIKDEPMADLAAQALGLPANEAPVIKEYVLSIKATKDQLMKLKSACNALSIVFSCEELTF